MTRRLSMTTRQELTEAVGERYRRSDRNEKREILDEFVELTGYHRKHAIRGLCRELRPPKVKPGPQRRYDDEVRAALITLWEAADRICGKRLKALIPTLIESMTRHGHLSLSKGVHQRLKQISAATIDRLLHDVREQAFGGQHRRASGVGSAIRRAVPIRTFSDWNDPLPGYFEIDFVQHCGGGKVDSELVHTLVMTDIATGWTECLGHAISQRRIRSGVYRAGPPCVAVSPARSGLRQRYRLHERDGVRLLQSDGNRADAVACIQEERPGVGRAEEWRYRSPAGRLRKAARSGGHGNPCLPLPGFAALRQLLPTA